MLIAIPRESSPEETRIAATPDSVRRLVKSGLKVQIESGLGAGLGVPDSDFSAAGATVIDNRTALLGAADLVIRVRPPVAADLELMRTEAAHLSFLDPFNNLDTVRALAARRITGISVEMIPRTTRAQKMDALSSQASLAGYAAVILAAERLNRIFPMMMTPAGTIQPARVFIIGAGVAGLQAIATAKRLGARVDAFDTRPAVKEQVESLGGRFVVIDLGSTGQTKDGYATQLTEEQVRRQREGQKKIINESDVVITTAQVFGRRAPILLTRDMLSDMKPGSVVVDLAVDSGGNVEGIEAGKEIRVNGAILVGLRNMPGRVAWNASQMLASNFASFLLEYWRPKEEMFHLDLKDDILAGCVITHRGSVIHPTISPLIEKEKTDS